MNRPEFKNHASESRVLMTREQLIKAAESGRAREGDEIVHKGNGIYSVPARWRAKGFKGRTLRNSPT